MRPDVRIVVERMFKSLALPGAGFEGRSGVFDGFGIGVGPELSGKHAQCVGLHGRSSGLGVCGLVGAGMVFLGGAGAVWEARHDGAGFKATGTPERWKAAPSCQLSKCSKQQGWAPLAGLNGGPPSR